MDLALSSANDLLEEGEEEEEECQGRGHPTQLRKSNCYDGESRCYCFATLAISLFASVEALQLSVQHLHMPQLQQNG